MDYARIQFKIPSNFRSVGVLKIKLNTEMSSEKRLRTFDLEFKLEVVKYAKEHSILVVGVQFGVDRKCVVEILLLLYFMTCLQNKEVSIRHWSGILR